MRLFYKEDGPVVEMPDDEAVFAAFVHRHTKGESSVIRVKDEWSSLDHWCILDCANVFAIVSGTVQHPDRTFDVWFRNRQTPLTFQFSDMARLPKGNLDDHFHTYLEAKASGKKADPFYYAMFGGTSAFAILWDDVIAINVIAKAKDTFKGGGGVARQGLSI